MAVARREKLLEEMHIGCSPHKEIEGAQRNLGKTLRNSKTRLPQRQNHHITATNAVHGGPNGPRRGWEATHYDEAARSLCLADTVDKAVYL